MPRRLRPGEKPLTASQVELINSGFRPRRAAWVVRLARCFVWPLIRPYAYYTLERAELASDSGAQLRQDLESLRQQVERLELPRILMELQAGLETLATDLQTQQKGLQTLQVRIDEAASLFARLEDTSRLASLNERLRSEQLALANRHAWIEDRVDHLLTQAANWRDNIEPRLAALETTTESRRLEADDRAVVADHVGRLDNAIADLSCRFESLAPQHELFLTSAQAGIFLLQRGDLISDSVRRDGVWDPHIVLVAERAAAAIRRRSDAGPSLLAVDVGSHFGLLTVAIAPFFDRVISFEPNLFNATLLRANVLLNGLAGKVEVRREALAAVAGSVSLAPSDRQEIPLPLDDHGIFQPGHARNLGAYSFVADGTGLSEAIARPLDSLSLSNLAFLKIDVQGGDGAVLAGATETIARCRPWVVFEWEKHLCQAFGVEFVQVQDQFHLAGYHLQVLHRHNEKQIDYLAVPIEESGMVAHPA
jgi:FkbM family methyltransferase